MKKNRLFCGKFLKVASASRVMRGVFVPALCFFGLILSFCIFGCSKAKGASGAHSLKIVTTIFPIYDWTREILGNSEVHGEKRDGVELTFLLGSGVDLHSYEPSVKDISAIKNADVVIFVGGESDEWVESALSAPEKFSKGAEKSGPKVVNLLEILGERAKAEEIKEGMQADHDEHFEVEEQPELDEHVWLSVKNAKIFCEAICDALCELEELNSDVYKKNLLSYTEKLDSLDKRFEETVSKGNKNTLLFGDRFPFRYFTDDYNLNYYAAFAGCSAETEASFETVIFLSKKIMELNLNSVLKIEGGDGKIAKTIVQNCKKPNVKVLTLDSMQSVTNADAKNGAAYISIMEKNLSVLATALE